MLPWDWYTVPRSTIVYTKKDDCRGQWIKPDFYKELDNSVTAGICLRRCGRWVYASKASRAILAEPDDNRLVITYPHSFISQHSFVHFLPAILPNDWPWGLTWPVLRGRAHKAREEKKERLGLTNFEHPKLDTTKLYPKSSLAPFLGCVVMVGGDDMYWEMARRPWAWREGTGLPTSHYISVYWFTYARCWDQKGYLESGLECKFSVIILK